MSHLSHPAFQPVADVLNTNGLLEQLKTLWVIAAVVAAVYVAFAAFRGKIGKAAGAIGVLVVSAVCYGLGLMVQTGAGTAFMSAVARLIFNA